ncbi:response regulator [Deferribacter autotrophicus]|uniref:Response regulator n=1 Tax=Deferribacter autotrophicus TaxID=500465 RepID=A0A5A8F765_9BACT|nr:response regulator [Deferribacter autotrophicus]KAA0258808.1 response regulator [Deferribacter autotrophicus]
MSKILAIDDSPTMHRLFKMIFTEENGYQLESAYNGEEGLEILKSFNPDIILLDFIMPKLNGFQFAKLIRNEMNKDTPILLITSRAEDVGTRFQERFTNIDFIAKPFQADDLVNKVEEMLNTKAGNTAEKSADYFSSSDYESLQAEESSVSVLPINKLQDNVMTKIIKQVEDGVLPSLRALIEKTLKFETGYMISDVKGTEITLEKLKELIDKFEGVLTFFNNERDIHFYIQHGFIIHAWIGDNKFHDVYELFQDICNTCLMEVETLSELYEQLRNLNFDDSYIQKYYESYLLSIIEQILEEDFRYYLDEVDIPETCHSRFKYDVSNLIPSYHVFKEEKIEINKIIFDDNLKPKKVDTNISSLSRFEKKIYELCDGNKNVGKIVKYFGNNKQIAKNTIGALVLTGFLEI